MARPRQRARHQPLPLEVVHGEHVGGHHYHHRDVEREQRAEDEEVLVVHLAVELETKVIRRFPKISQSRRRRL